MTCFLLLFNGHDHRVAIVNIVGNGARCDIIFCCRSAHRDTEWDGLSAVHQLRAIRSAAVLIRIIRGKYQSVGRHHRARWSLYLLHRCRSPCVGLPIPWYPGEGKIFDHIGRIFQLDELIPADRVVTFRNQSNFFLLVVARNKLTDKYIINA